MAPPGCFVQRVRNRLKRNDCHFRDGDTKRGSGNFEKTGATPVHRRLKTILLGFPDASLGYLPPLDSSESLLF